MAQTFNLPAVGDTMVEGEVVEWFVAVGDTVSIDQPICSIETDKSVVEMTTPYTGTVLALGAASGGVVEVGRPLIVVGADGEVVDDLRSPSDAAPASGEPTATSPALTGEPPTSVSGEVRSPLVRRLAAELRVELSAVPGSGPGGRITRADVEAAAANSSSVPTTNSPLDARPPRHTAVAPAGMSAEQVRAMPKVRRVAREAGIDLARIAGSGPNGAVLLSDLHPNGRRQPERRERLSALRRSIGAHLTESATTIPQFTAMVDVDVTALMATRAALIKRLDTAIPIDAVIMSLLIPVLRDHPQLNARLDGDEIVYFDHFDIGVAVDTPDGLIVPVVTDVAGRSVAEIASEIVRLANAARNRSIRPEELSGATCTLNNVGAVGIEAGTPILPVGTTAIIAPGRAKPTVRLHSANAVEVPVMTISATFDHRVVDGGDAGRFLTQLRDHLEVPALGLL